MRLKRAPSLVALGLSAVGIVLAILGPAVWTLNMPEYITLAFLFVGNIYLTLVLIVWRIWFAFRRQAACSWAHAAVALVLFAPAVLATLEAPVGKTIADTYVFMALGGLYGWPLLLLLIAGFVAEPLIRASRRSSLES